jgi:NAD+ synthetase
MDLKIVLHQASFEVGNIEGNAKKIIDLYNDSQCDLVVFPELSLTGYNCKDLFLNSDFIYSIESHIEKIAANTSNKALIFGTPTMENGKLFNSAVLIREGKIENIYNKRFLPNYKIFDERRYFHEGDKLSSIFEVNGNKINIMICEDIWQEDEELYMQCKGCDTTLIINGSPYSINKTNKRINLIESFGKKYNQKFVLYLNTIGGQDNIIFDGGSIVFANGTITSSRWRESAITVSEDIVEVDSSDKYNRSSTRGLPLGNVNYIKGKANIFNLDCNEASNVYNGIILALRDYAKYAKCNKFVIGLSGGIDSALVAVIAVDAFGPENVLTIAMPSQYSSEGSISDARELARRLSCKFEIIPIIDIHSSLKNSLKPLIGNVENHLVNENLQPRIRAAVLMAIANRENSLVLCTSNKSESAVGYTTIYGDMTGAYGPIVDIYKTQVYALSRWRNELSDVIPETIIAKEPSAELRPNQRDVDSLPKYEVLDEILYNLIEVDSYPSGFDQSLVSHIESLLYKSEFKRFQSPPGPKINSVMLSSDRRYPLSVKKII